jgi:hypothetical protein
MNSVPEEEIITKNKGRKILVRGFGILVVLFCMITCLFVWKSGVLTANNLFKSSGTVNNIAYSSSDEIQALKL